MTVFTVSGSTMNSRWRTPRPFSLVRGQSLFLGSGTYSNYVTVNMIDSWTCVYELAYMNELGNCWTCSDYWTLLGTLRRSHGQRLELNTLWSPPVSSLIRTRLLPTWRFVSLQIYMCRHGVTYAFVNFSWFWSIKWYLWFHKHINSLCILGKI